MFITLEDPRAKIKGSRDPLGVQPIWALFGRHLVTNLTTVTSSVREFSVLLLGRYLGETLLESGLADEEDAVPIFLRVEQIAAYARHVSYGIEGIRGITRVHKFLDEQQNRVQISNNSKHMILSDQQMYGIWGLYSVAGRASGLLAEGPVGLTDLAREFVDAEYNSRLPKSAIKRFQDFAKHGGTLEAKKNNGFLKAVAEIFAPVLSNGERRFYAETVRDVAHATGEVVPRRQAHLASVILTVLEANDNIGRASIRALSKVASINDAELARRLQTIDRIEALIAPAEAIFELLLARNNQHPSEIAKEILDIWGREVPYLDEPLDALLTDIIEAAGIELTSVIRRCDRALHSADYAEAIACLLEWNKLVMQRRGAAPWLKLGAEGRLDVRYRGEEHSLPTGDELPDYWRNSYFLDSLASITFQIESGKV